MKYNQNLKRGNAVRIRLPDGTVVDGKYRHQLFEKSHVVEAYGAIFVADHYPPFISTNGGCNRVRFVYPVEQMK
jgi:hypothetical protein